MSIYRNEWPLLVLCPSGARYHWENEFKQWLGVESSVNNSDEEKDKTFPDCKKSSDEGLLHDWQINVLTSSKSTILPHSDTTVVICSYGLAPALVASGKIYPRLFRCAIVDESHMLKNKVGLASLAFVIVWLLAAVESVQCLAFSQTLSYRCHAQLLPGDEANFYVTARSQRD